MADCKLATSENMAYLHQRQGRFVTVLPRTHGEDAAFRDLVAKGRITWRTLWEKTDEDGEVIDRYSTSDQPATAAVAEILQGCGTADWIVTEIPPQAEETFHQDHRGRPGKDTRYVKKVATRFDLSYRIDDARVAENARSDGVFPLVSNVAELDTLELLHAYKRQPAIEKRFSQLKTDFEVAPVYLKAVHRIQSLLCMDFFALLVEALLERQLRQAMHREEIDSLPMYPEGRGRRWPTARRVIDLFASAQRHTLEQHRRPTEVLVTELTRLQRKLLKLIGLPAKTYGR